MGNLRGNHFLGVWGQKSAQYYRCNLRESDFLEFCVYNSVVYQTKRSKNARYIVGEIWGGITFWAFGGGHIISKRGKGGIFFDILYTSVRYGSQKPKKQKFLIENKAYFYYFLCSSVTDTIVMKWEKKALILFSVLKQIPSTGWPFRLNVWYIPIWYMLYLILQLIWVLQAKFIT